MNLVQETIELIRKEILLELRNKSAISGILLYVFTTTFVVYLTFITVDGRFLQENSNRQMYYYTLANPLAIVFSKMIYNTILLLVIGLLCFGLFSLFVGNPVKDIGLFLLTLFLSSIGLSIAFTFISAISIKANNSATLMVILSFPVIVPILMTLIKLSANSLRLIQDTAYESDLIILIAIDAILFAIVLILFPFLWRD